MAAPGIGDRLEGFHAVQAAIASGRVVTLTVERHRTGSPSIDGLIDQAGAAGVQVRVVDQLPSTVTAAPQGVAATARPIVPVGLKELVAGAATPVLLVLDHLEDPRNVGAVVRSAVAAGAGGLVIAAKRSAPLGPSAFKAAAGALERLPVAVINSIADGVRQLKALGLWTVALDGSGSQSLFDVRVLADPVALIVGAEGRGVSRLVLERADVVARIPMVGGVESLNASVAASLALFEIGRARGELE